jgi:iron(II)-dependent oxidoreductase
MTLHWPRSIAAHLAAVRQFPLFAVLVPGVTMNTTGSAVEAIGGLYEGDRLAPALAESRARTLALYAHLDLEALRVPCLPIVNPPLWELAHIAWFQERWCLRYDPKTERLARASMLPEADALFDSSAVPHDSRWSLAYPPAKVLLGYMSSTLAATLEALERAPDEKRYFFELALLHEDMHGEALLMTLQSLALPAPSVGAREPQRSTVPRPRDVPFAGGPFQLGAARGTEQFTFDNEKWAHEIHIAPFAMRASPVTQGEFRRFVEDGGYQRSELWTPEGWAWRSGLAAESPVYWKRDDERWLARRFDGFVDLDDAAPMVHASLHEALAFCRWSDRRLPTEAEWEFAARNGTDDRYPWGDVPLSGDTLDLRCMGPSLSHREPGASKSGLRQLLGGVWEWTSSPFLPYPGFSADPYRDYSQPWFGSHFVLRGGCFATRARLAHSRFRNFYLPHRSDAFAGFRTCAKEA